MDALKNMKETLMSCIQGQMTHLDSVDTKELGEVVDMVKDLSEAIYYCTITEAMEGKGKEKETHHYYHDRDIDRANGRMYYDMYPIDYNKMYYNGGTGSSNGSRNYSELEYTMMRDGREGRSPISRKAYMEAKEMHQPKTTQMKELEKYLQELSSDITEMIYDATPEEKQLLEKKLTGLASKISAQ